MADIVYTPTFKHDDWIDNQDVVQADGDRGFNAKFHQLETEFARIKAAFAAADATVKSLQRLKLVFSRANVKADPGKFSDMIAFDTYDRTSLGLPDQIERVYFPIAVFPPPPASPACVLPSFSYQPEPGNINKMTVLVQVFNPGLAPVSFTLRIFSYVNQ